MGHTNSTANLSLPQFIGTDKPTWLGDINGAMSAIDAYAGTNDAAVTAAASDASSAVTQAATAVNTANSANTTAGNASTAANNAVGVANNAVAIAGTVDGKVGLLANLTTTDRTSIVNAINEVNAAVGTLPSAAQVSYDNTGSGLVATDVQNAIDEVVTMIGGGGAGSVSVTADGSKTYSQLFDELYALIDQTKITVNSTIKFVEAARTRFYQIAEIATSAITLTASFTDSNYPYTFTINCKSASSTLYSYYSGTAHDDSSSVAASGVKLEFVY